MGSDVPMIDMSFLCSTYPLSVLPLVLVRRLFYSGFWRWYLLSGLLVSYLRISSPCLSWLVCCPWLDTLKLLWSILFSWFWWKFVASIVCNPGIYLRVFHISLYQYCRSCTICHFGLLYIPEISCLCFLLVSFTLVLECRSFPSTLFFILYLLSLMPFMFKSLILCECGLVFYGYSSIYVIIGCSTFC